MIIKLREYSVDIVELFEDILDRYDIDIPDEDRTGDESEARLYGMTYSNLEEDVVAILEDLVKNVKEHKDAEIDSYDL